MPKIRIIVLDRTRTPFLKEGEAFYLNRIQKYSPVEWVEVKPTPIKKGRSDRSVLETEGKSIARRLTREDFPIAVDQSGRSYDSTGFAARMEALFQKPFRLSFIIGGPLGLSEEVINLSCEVISLSPLTLTHEMSRLLLLEQLYRAFTIIKGERYHK